MCADYHEIGVHNTGCPYCGESLDILVDPAEVDHQYIEDCQVCCRPITIRVYLDEENPDGPATRIEALHENDY